MKSLPASRFPHGEPPYQPHLWNNGSINVKVTHNCYTYMLNDLYYIPRIYGKPQPGYFVDTNKLLRFSSLNRLSCKEITKGVSRDNPHIKVLKLKDGKYYKCPPNYYK